MDKPNSIPQYSLVQKYETYLRDPYRGDTATRTDKMQQYQTPAYLTRPESQITQYPTISKLPAHRNESDLPNSAQNTLQLSGINVYDSQTSFRRPLSPRDQLSHQFKSELNRAIQEFVPQKIDKTSKLVVYQGTRPPNYQKDYSEPNISDRSQNPTKKPKSRDIVISDDDLTFDESQSNLMPPVFKNDTSRSTLNKSGSKIKKSIQSPNNWSPSSGAKHSKSNISKSRAKLDSSRKENEANDIEDKYRRLKCKAQEMRKLLREYATKCSDIEDLLDERTEQLQQSQDELSRVQADLLRHLENLHKYAQREEEWANSEKQFRAVIEEFSQGEHKQKKRFEEIEAMIVFNEQKYLSQVQAFESDKLRVHADIKTRDHVINEQTRVLESLQSELEALRNEKTIRGVQFEDLKHSKDEEIKRVKEQLVELENQNKDYYYLNEQLKAAKAQLEEKVSKLKHKFDKSGEEREKIQQENNDALYEKKQKINTLKDEIKRLTEEKRTLGFNLEREKEVSGELESLKIELKDLQQSNKELKAENESLKVHNDNIFRNHQKEFEKATQLQSELQRKTKELKKVIEKADEGEKNLKIVEEIMDQLKIETNLLITENEKARAYIFELEAAVASSNSRFDEISKELWELRAENEGCKKDYEECKKNYEKARQINIVFQNDLNILETKLEAQQKSQAANEKLRALNDIQGLIQNYRLSNIQNQNYIPLDPQ